ncbi:hypothetical protein N6H14_31665 [Paenibacillus sp. CC-CFT747]|nr:hypothetical protein N6H14_31665 [Paenibacillus sp. CC-CFT747]
MKGSRAGRGIHYSCTALLLALTLFPFYLLLISSGKDKGQLIRHFWTPVAPFHWEHYGIALKQLWPFLLHSVWITLCLILCVLINGLTAGYAFARFQFAGKGLLFAVVMSLVLIPGFLLLIPQFMMFRSLGLLNTLSAQFLGPMAGASSLAVLLIRTFFEGIPRSLTDAAAVEGRGS